MAPWNDQLLVDIDDRYDRENASDNVSRYGAYLRQRPDEFRDSWQDEPAPIKTPEEFAVHAWRVATAPVMVPGYVRVRPDLHGVTIHRDDDDGSLYADIHVPLQHHHIGGGPKRFPYSWQDWETERDFGSSGKYLSMLEPRVGAKTSVLAKAVVRIPGREWTGLVTPTAYEGRMLCTEAMLAVAVVAQHVNDAAGPIVATLLRD